MFAKLDSNLQALTFDCVMATSKLCQALNYRDTKDQIMMYDHSRTGMRVKEDIEIRKTLQSNLTNFMDNLKSQNSFDLSKFGDIPRNVCNSLHTIQIEMH